MKEKVLVTWTTEDEIRYLIAIGENTKHYTEMKKRLSDTDKIERKKRFLKRALATYNKRMEWGCLDRARIIDFTTGELSRL